MKYQILVLRPLPPRLPHTPAWKSELVLPGTDPPIPFSVCAPWEALDADWEPFAVVDAQGGGEWYFRKPFNP